MRFIALLCCAALIASATACKRTSNETAPDSETQSSDPANENTAQEPTPSVPAPPDVARVPEEAESSKSGLAWKVLETGEGEKRPDRYAIITVNFTGWTPDGKTFDTGKRRGTLQDFIPGWVEGIQLMLPGEKRRFWIPAALAYGEPTDGSPDAPTDQPKGMLVYDIELLESVPGPRPPREVPEDVAAIPDNAEQGDSCLAWRVLKEGGGEKHPDLKNTVAVHYAAWTTDGKMFDTSLRFGGPAMVPLEQAMPGWQEGIPKMTVGEMRRFWIPEDLAFAGADSMPRGMVVYDIHLVGFQ